MAWLVKRLYIALCFTLAAEQECPVPAKLRQEIVGLAIPPRRSPGRQALMIGQNSRSAGVTTLSFHEQMTGDAKNAFPATLVRDPACNGVPDDTS